jgi:hypothetical protein
MISESLHILSPALSSTNLRGVERLEKERERERERERDAEKISKWVLRYFAYFFGLLSNLTTFHISRRVARYQYLSFIIYRT